MKKILTLLVLAIFACGNTYAAYEKRGKTTIKATAGNGRGTVLVEISQPIVEGGMNSWGYIEYRDEEDLCDQGTWGPTSEGWGYSIYGTKKLGKITIGIGSKGIKYRLSAKPNPGYYFLDWDSVPNKNGGTENDKQDIIYLGETKYSTSNQNFTSVIANFGEQYAYWKYAEAEAILIGPDNKPFKDDNENYVHGACYVGIQAEPTNHTVAYGAYGDYVGTGTRESAKISLIYNYHASDGGDNYEFVGWFIANENGELVCNEDGTIYINNEITEETRKQNPYPYTLESEVLWSEKTAYNVPKFRKMYAVYRPKFYLYEYDRNLDQFSETAMPHTIKDGIFVYEDKNVSSTQKTYYKIEHPYGENANLDCFSEDNFSGEIQKNQEHTVLCVTPQGSAPKLEGTITIRKDGNSIATINLEANSNPILVYLNPAEDLSGTYSYIQETNPKEKYYVTTSTVEKQMMTYTDYAFTFEAIPAEGRQFDKWEIKKGEQLVYTSEDKLISPPRFGGGESVTPYFKPSNVAQFIVLSEPSVKYVDLQKAIDRAAYLNINSPGQVVAVYAPKEGTDVRLEKGNYTIKDGVTLLIPGDNKYSNIMRDFNKDDVTVTTGENITSCYCKLSVDDNTNITVENGNISIFSGLKAFQHDNGGRIKYGQLHLGKNCKITVEKGGLYAFGFITGDKSSQVVMESKTTVYEVFNFKDCRGTSELFTLNNNKNKVFPFGQYYIQSVEVPLTLKCGAIEKVSTAVFAGGHYAMNFNFIGDTQDALFNLGANTSITKSYDPETDHLKLEFVGTSKESSCINTGSIKTKLAGYDLNSANYVLPIQSNMDIEVKNTAININSDIALMPSSKLVVHADAKIKVIANANMFVYGYGAYRIHEDHIGGCHGGYWGINNGHCYTLLQKNKNPRPGGLTTKNAHDATGDATIILDGEMEVLGALYTVKGNLCRSGDQYGGANITSNGGGKIIVSKIDNKEVTYQYHMNYGNPACGKGGFQPIPLTSPNLLLHNDESKNPDSVYTAVSSTGTFVYYQQEGMWKTSTAGITGIKLYDEDHNEISKFRVTNPTLTSVNGYVVASVEGLSGAKVDDFNIDVSGDRITLRTDETDETVTFDGAKLTIPVEYTVQDIHGEYPQKENGVYPTNLSISHESIKDSQGNQYPYCATIFAIEDYTPRFSIPSTLDFYARVGESTPIAMPITYDEDNVVAILPLDLTLTGDRSKWTVLITGTNANDFEFSFGESGSKLSGAKVIFKPTTSGTKKATLKLKATYYDQGNPKQKLESEQTVTLIGNALVVANTLEFNEVGVITTNTPKFALLKSSSINSNGQIEILEPSPLENEIFDIESVTIDNKQNYYITPKGKQGQLKFKVSQGETDSHTGTTIEKTFIVVADTKELGTNGICTDDSADVVSLTTHVDGQVSFNYDDDEPRILFNGQASWTIQFEGMPGVLTFTPDGDGYWAIEESKGSGYDWSPTTIYWTQLPNMETSINLHPTTRSVKISYNGTDGSIEGLCIYPFSIYAEQSKIYVPIKNSSVQTSVRFIHSEPSLSNVTVPDGWNTDETKSYVSTTDNQGGVFNTFYYTDVRLEASNVSEQNSGLTVTATQSNGSAMVNIGTYNFPKPLPIKSNSWVSSDTTENINGYDESEHYYHYMVTSSYVKWDAQRRNLVFLNKGTDSEASRQVVFGYHGLPDMVQFQSASKMWTIEESTDGNTWKSAINQSGDSVIETDEDNNFHTIKQPISYTSKYVRITFNDANAKDEVYLTNLIIKGSPSAIPDLEEPYKVVVTDEGPATFDIHVMNLPYMKLALDMKDVFTLYHRPKSSENEEDWTEITFEGESGNLISYDAVKYPYLAVNEKGYITIKVDWNKNNQQGALEGLLQILHPDNDEEVLSEVRLVCQNNVITQETALTDIWTGYDPKIYVLEGSSLTPGSGFEPYDYHQVDVKNAFADGKALFDYLIIYGETTTNDGTAIITTPGGENGSGSNARTPYYIYRKRSERAYEYLTRVDNANSSTKLHLEKDDDVIEVPANKPLSVYITGFCPYASTGYTYHDEGVWYFRGTTGSRLDLYLEDCHIYSRNKTESGAKYGKNHPESSETAFSGFDVVVQGSGAVLVFENKLENTQIIPQEPFQVAIHTIGRNILKSAYGSYNNILGLSNEEEGGQSVSGTVLVAQVSASVQVRLTDREHHAVSKTVIDFDDCWPNATSTYRTNGFLSLQKQANHAPSIDLGNPLTEINFRGGQVQLQNASILSPNYKTTFAISHRSGIMGNVPDVPFAYGLGSDDTGGTVNFYDGTTTVIPMKIEGPYRDFYLMDEDRPDSTSCLRTPTNTFIYGGSHCMIRACNYVTSKGGAPTDGVNPLGLFKYRLKDADKIDTISQLVTLNSFPDKCYAPYYQDQDSVTEGYQTHYPDSTYGKSSLTAVNDTLNLWLPDLGCTGFEELDPEVDKELIYWLIGMPEITGGETALKAHVGGNVHVDDDDEIKNILYCELDDYTYNVIRANNGVNAEGDTLYTYVAPVKDPTGQVSPYVDIPLVNVGPKNECSIIRASDYEVTNKLYYVTTAQADKWMNFTMPFDVARIWVVEAHSEAEIEAFFKKSNKTAVEKRDGESDMQATLRYQAKHNANFASFFAMSMAAIGAYGTTFEQIYNEYITWAKIQDKYVEGPYNTYNNRGMYELQHYDGTAASFFTANYYLYKNTGDWGLNLYDSGTPDENDDYYGFETKWQVAPAVTENDGILMNRDTTYSMLFPYCTGCENEETIGEDRNYWDYWSGKLLIFESTDRTDQKNNPHIIHGSDYISVEPVEGSDHIFSELDEESNKAVLIGNSTFSKMDLSKYPEAENDKLFTYFNSRWEEKYVPAYDMVENNIRKYHTLMPTGTLLRVGCKTKKPIKLITRDGRIVTDDSEDQGNGNQGTTTGGHMPTVGGGSDMFITGTDNGINVAVASPQMVYVVTTTGAVIYSGYVESDINIPLPISGIYLIKGENEVQKIFY